MKDALRKELIIAPFVERFKTATLRKVLLINFVSTYAIWLKEFIFVHFLLIESLGKRALLKESDIALSAEWFKTATLRKPY